MDAILALLIKYRYLALFPAAAVEGPLVALIAGFLVSTGSMSILPAYIIMLFGDIIPDSIYYAIGRFGDRGKVMKKYGAKSELVSKNFKLVEMLWRDHGKKTMFFGKLAYGLSIPFLVSAGLVGMSFGRFLVYTIPVTMLQYAVIMVIGFYMGESWNAAGKYVQYAYFIIAGVVILFGMVYLYISKFAKKKMIELEKEELKEV